MQHSIELCIGQVRHEIRMSIDYVNGLAYWQVNIYIDGYPDAPAILYGQHSSYQMAIEYGIGRMKEIAAFYASLHTDEILTDAMQ